jgi:hypothetical protein
MTAEKRRVDVFTAGCSRCQDTVRRSHPWPAPVARCKSMISRKAVQRMNVERKPDATGLPRSPRLQALACYWTVADVSRSRLAP